MSSVGSADSGSGTNASQTDAIRRNREEAQRAETEMVKKHQKEIRRLNEEHYAEVENLKKDHTAQMDDLRETSHENISDRDHKYQQDIEEMRGLYRKQLQTQADDTGRREDAVKLAKVVDNGNEKQQMQNRLTKLSKDYQKNLDQRGEESEVSAQQNREAQHRALDTTREKLTQHYESENKALNDERRSEVGGLQNDFSEYKRAKGAELKEAQVKQLQEKQRDSDALLRAVQQERMSSADAQDNLREGFRDGLAKTREKFEKAYGRDRGAGDAARQQLKDSVGQRMDEEVTRLKLSKQDQADEATRHELALRQQNQREIADVKDGYQKNIDNIKGKLDNTHDESTERMHKGIDKVRKDLTDQAVEQNRFYRIEEDQQNRIHKNAYDQLKSDAQVRQEQSQVMADTRVKNIYESTADEKARLIEQQTENHSVSQRAHQDDMIALRSSLEDEKQTAVTALTDRLQKQEMQHSDRMAQVVGKYEKQIQGLKDQMMHEKRQSDETMKRAVEEMQRVHKTSVDQIEAQNRDRMHMLENSHAEELRSLNKRNDVKINEVLSEVKKT